MPIINIFSFNMKNPYYLFILGLGLVTLAGGCIQYQTIGDNQAEPNQLDAEPTVITDVTEPEPVNATSSQEMLIGGDRDSHGCLVGAGYQYCPSKEKCVRVWEDGCSEISEIGLTQAFADDDENLAASGTIAYLQASDYYKQNNGDQIYIAKFEAGDCSGCYTVTANYKVNVDNKVLRMTATLNMVDWDVKDTTLIETPIKTRTANECVGVDGRVLIIEGDNACKYEEAYVGPVSDESYSEGQYICCK